MSDIAKCPLNLKPSIKQRRYETESPLNNKRYILKHNATRIYVKNAKFRY
jgi:hypothetical protein